MCVGTLRTLRESGAEPLTSDRDLGTSLGVRGETTAAGSGCSGRGKHLGPQSTRHFTPLQETGRHALTWQKLKKRRKLAVFLQSGGHSLFF